MNMKKAKWLLLGAALMAQAGFAGPIVTFTMDPPNGALWGPQGTSVGWGYTITTDSFYLLINSITFEDLTPVGTMPTSTWFISSAIISNASPVTVVWSAGLDGLQYDIDPGAAVGSQTTGKMDLNYEWFDDANLTTDLGTGDVFATNGGEAAVVAEVNVLQGTAPGPEVPEPGVVFLTGPALAALILRRKLAHA